MQIKLIDFGAAAAVGTEERVGFDAGTLTLLALLVQKYKY
jgi:hypothetical protein